MRTDAHRAADKRYDAKRKGQRKTLSCIVSAAVADKFNTLCASRGTTVNAMLAAYVMKELEGGERNERN